MKKVTLLLALITSLNQSIFSQQDNSLKNIVPPSPEATAFAKYGTYPIGTYTGRPDITIPIYEIKSGGLTVPISISYDATGIRVNDMASWVGMNWSLNAGGMVSQMIVGKPDIPSAPIGFNSVPPRASEIVNNTTYFNYLQALVDGDVMAPANPDAEPDKFFYSLNGTSGSFVFDRNRNIMQIPKTSRKISVVGSISGFNIVDETGTTYIFNFLEGTKSYNYSYAGAQPSPPGNGGSLLTDYTTGYYLTEIISNDGIQHIYFSYDYETTVARDDMYEESYGDRWLNEVRNSNYHEYIWRGVQREMHIPRLKSISFSNGKVDFSRVSNRTDDGAGFSSSRLDEIVVYQKTGTIYSKLKSFKFAQGYYYSPDTYGQYSGFPNANLPENRYRLRLDALKLKDANGLELSSYKFSYNNTTLPPKTSSAQDWWGYYNGKSNISLVPTTSIPDGNGGTTTIGNADRKTDETYMKAGILEKIEYPTGGYTNFVTEAHKIYSEYSIVSDSYSANAQGMSNTLDVKTFIAPASIENGSGSLTINIGPYTSGYPQPFVKIKNMSTAVEQTFTSTDMTQWFFSKVPYTFTSGTTYEITASCYVSQSYASANLVAGFSKSIVDPHNDAIGGLRIKSIKNYGADNILANEENYEYGGGVFVGIGGNAYSYGRSVVACYSYIQYCLTGYGYKMIYGGGPLFSQSLVQGSPVVYTDVVKYYGNSSGNIGKTSYYYGTDVQQWAETQPLPSGQYLANNEGIIIINNNWKKGQLLKQQDFISKGNNVYDVIRESENNYNVIYTDTTFGLFSQTKFNRINSCSFCPRNFNDYAYAEYPVYSGYVQLAQSTVRDYSYSLGGNGIKESIINYTYDNTRKDIEVKTNTLNSKGETIETEKKYPFHKAQLLTSITALESTALDDMVTKNMITPIEEIKRINSVQSLLKKTTYEYVNTSTIAPVNLKFQVGSNTIETRVLYTKYDAFGNLLTQQKANDLKTTYIWGYDRQYPVAQITNADYTNVAGLFTQATLDNSSISDADIRTELNKIRLGLPGNNALVTTYTYKPLVGITSQTDPNGKTTYYSYDGFSRLQSIKDQEGKIVKQICYNYAGQVEDCSVNVTPVWAATGNVRCVTNSGANTGYQEREERDTNPNSATYGQLQWVSNGYNTTACPLPVAPCSFTINSAAFGMASSGINSAGNTVSFYIVFYPTGTMTPGNTYLVATITGVCKPTVTRTINFSSSGRDWAITINPSGSVYFTLASYSPSVSSYNTVATPTLTYNL